MSTDLAFQQSPANPADYELITELASGCLGPLILGRALAGHDRGRYVTVRHLPAGDLYLLEPALARAAEIAHPRLVKVLGLACIEGSACAVSEYVEGLPLGELARAMRAADTSVVPEVALRIGSDMLLAVVAARRELGSGLSRCLYADTAWVASFGETLLSDVGAARELHAAHGALSRSMLGCTPEETRGQPPDERSDVFAAGVLLWELLSGQSPSENGSSVVVPRLDALESYFSGAAEPLIALVTRALANDPDQRFQRVEAMLEALQRLPRAWFASEAEVRAAVEPLARVVSDLESAASLAPSGEHEIDPWDSPTRSMKMPVAAQVEGGVTAPPPSPLSFRVRE